MKKHVKIAFSKPTGAPNGGLGGGWPIFFIKTCLITKMLAKFGGFSFISLEIKKIVITLMLIMARKVKNAIAA